MRARAAIKFELTGIPQDATITSAKIKFLKTWSEWGADADMNVYKISRTDVDWKTMTWSNYASGKAWTKDGGDYVSPAAVTAVIPGMPIVDTVQYDVTALVNGYLANPASNTGVIIIISGGSSGQTYCSTEISAVGSRPKLVVTYDSGGATDVARDGIGRITLTDVGTTTTLYSITGKKLAGKTGWKNGVYIGNRNKLLVNVH